MRVKIEAGAEFDALTPGELERELERLRRELHEDLGPGRPLLDTFSATPSTDAAGNLGGGLTGNGLPVYTVPTGRIARLHRVALADPTHTASAPLLGGAAQALVLQGSAALPNPAAGADWIATVPAGHTWTLLSAQGTLTTSAAVATRLPGLDISDGAGHIIVTEAANVGVTASIVERVGFAVGDSANQDGVGAALGNRQTVALPSGIVLPAGYTIASRTVNIQAADQWSAVVLTVLDSSAGGPWIAGYRDRPTPGSLSFIVPLDPGSAAVIPSLPVLEGGGADVLKDGQVLVVCGAGLPASTVIGISGLVALFPHNRP